MPKIGLISASMCGVLLTNGKIAENAPFGVGAITYAMELARQRAGIEDEEQYVSFAMERGIELEWAALETYQERNLVELHGQQEWGAHPDFPYFGGTPDGLVGTVGGVDAKCRNNKEQHEYIKNGIGKKDTDQFQAYMMIFGREWWDLGAYNPRFPEPLDLVTHRLYPDPAWVEKMTERLPLFEAIVQRETEYLLEKLNN